MPRDLPSPQYPLLLSFLYTGRHHLQEASQPELGVGGEPFCLGSGVGQGGQGALALCAVGALRPLGRAGT